MVRQRENDVSEVQLISLYKYGVNFTVSMIIVFKLSIFTIILCFSTARYI